MARLTGQPTELLSFEQVRESLRGISGLPRGLQEIPLDAIVGSVGRYADFSRTFLPLDDSQGQRWARVKAMSESLTGLPPIEVYKIGDAFFVRDGHHRVSVARSLGAKSIEGYVTEVDVKLPLEPDVRPEELILKAEYAQFLARTRLDELRPGADWNLTEAGKYPVLEEHIDVHRYFMGLDMQRDVSYAEAVAHWYDQVYLPVIEVIRSHGLLMDFPGRTEADLYLWIAEHRADLEQSLGWQVETGQAAQDLAAQHSPRPDRVAEQIGEKLLGSVIPAELNPGPPPGEWRRERARLRRDDRMFEDVLVPLRGDEPGWEALTEGLEIAQREGGRVLGLHLIAHPDEADSERVHRLRETFEGRCRQAGIEGNLAIDVGPATRKICDRAAWTDLAVVSLAHPPAPSGVSRLASGFRNLIRRCPRPILAVPHGATAFGKVLLAFDGSPKAREGLYVAAYMGGAWGAEVLVLAVDERGQGMAEAADEAQIYLARHGVTSAIREQTGEAAEAILSVSTEAHADLVVMGGYGASPMVEAVLGSAVDEVLRCSQVPVLLCR